MNKSIKGYAFEFFIKQLLLRNGFTPVKSDDKLIYDTSIGQMIHGLGQPHNADVLVSPPFQTPFYFPTRLLVECKCYDKELGIAFVRNVLGLREDINNFDIVTPEILNNRRNYRRNSPAVFNYERFTYQVALASLTGFKETAQEFALVHRIPLITFTSDIFKPIRELILSIDNVIAEAHLNSREISRVLRFFHSNQVEKSPNLCCQYINEYADNVFDNWFNEFIHEINEIAENIDIGIMDNGNLLFMYRESFNQNLGSYNDGYSLHWKELGGFWALNSHELRCTYKFELPQDIMNEWLAASDYRSKAVNLKVEYFKTILVYHMSEKKYPEIKVLRLSKEFIRHAISNQNSSKD